jgi:formylglycine-generating enzyme required for sulfatase activity
MKLKPLDPQCGKPLTQSTMNIRRLKILLARTMSASCLALWVVALSATAQAQPSLGLRISGGQPTLGLTGTVGTVYSIQYATDLSPTSQWIDRTLLKAQAGSNDWSEPPTAPTPGQRFYRAVSVPAPADTNLVFISPGTFTMGSPTNEVGREVRETQHTVTLTRGFWMGRYEVTQGEYLDVVGQNPSFFRNGVDGSDTGGTGGPITDELRHPVDSVSWYDATNYCALRTQQERAGGLIPTNYVYRLPTEAEWEYACRAGTTTAFYLGSSLRSGQANFDGRYEYDAAVGTIENTNGIYLGRTTPVGSYAANGWGLYDMAGNVWEWCQDWWSGDNPAESVVDPQGPAMGEWRVMRGGNCYMLIGGYYCRSALQWMRQPYLGSRRVGFRVVLALDQ